MNKKQLALLAGSVVTIVLAALVIWASFRPKALEGVKTLTISVNHTDGTVHTEELDTTARYLSEALEPLGLIRVADWGSGPFILEADGETVDGTGGKYWYFTVNGESPEFGVDTQPITDGDSFSIFTIVY